MSDLTVKTSQPGWLAKVAEAYKNRRPLTIVDDANVGINPSSDSLFTMGKKANLGAQEWTAVVIALGIAAAGAYLLVMAIFDPEPFSKMALTVAAGTVMIMGGGFAAIRLLTNQKPPNVRLTTRGFEVGWE